MSDIEKIPSDGSPDSERVPDEDFEGHRMMDSKVEPKFEERVEQ